MKKETFRVKGDRRKTRLPEEMRERISAGGTHRSKKDYDRNQAKKEFRNYQGW